MAATLSWISHIRIFDYMLRLSWHIMLSLPLIIYRPWPEREREENAQKQQSERLSSLEATQRDIQEAT